MTNFLYFFIALTENAGRLPVCPRELLFSDSALLEKLHQLHKALVSGDGNDLSRGDVDTESGGDSGSRGVGYHGKRPMWLRSAPSAKSVSMNSIHCFAAFSWAQSLRMAVPTTMHCRPAEGTAKSRLLPPRARATP